MPLFAGLTEDELAAVAGRFEERQVKAGARLVTEGASGYSFFVIASIRRVIGSSSWDVAAILRLGRT